MKRQHLCHIFTPIIFIVGGLLMTILGAVHISNTEKVLNNEGEAIMLMIFGPITIFICCCSCMNARFEK